MQVRTLHCYLHTLPESIRSKFHMIDNGGGAHTVENYVFQAYLEPEELPSPPFSFVDGRIFHNGKYVAAYRRQ